MHITYGAGSPANKRSVHHTEIRPFLAHAQAAYMEGGRNSLGAAISMVLEPGDATRYEITIARSTCGTGRCLVVMTCPDRLVLTIDGGGWLPTPGDEKIDSLNLYTQCVLADVVDFVVGGSTDLRWYDWDGHRPRRLSEG